MSLLAWRLLLDHRRRTPKAPPRERRFNQRLVVLYVVLVLALVLLAANQIIPAVAELSLGGLALLLWPTATFGARP